uniref:Uncharacterized protein n=1 Tax=Setaria viridis TaxID=4556 RepID=A0A4U6VAB9_SETVI|nr:hypothetical protein SEVIR_3G116600v2 [Setaria viridis]
MAVTTDDATATRSLLSPPPAVAKDPTDAEKLRFIEEVTSDVDAVQERVLAEILGRNAETEYLSKCGLSGATDRAPPSGPGCPCPYVSSFFCSSGTSGGEFKLIPSVDGDLDRRQSLLDQPRHATDEPGSKGLYILFVRQETKTPAGLRVQSILTSYYKSDHFIKNLPSDPCNDYTSPATAVLCEDAFQSMYAHTVCGLCQRRDVVRVGAVFTSTLVRAVRFLQLNWDWERLAAYIDAGVLTPLVSRHRPGSAGGGRWHPPAPDPELARLIRVECSSSRGGGDDDDDGCAGIITRVWPNTKYLDVIVTGAMTQYIPALKHYSGGLPMVCTKYASTEGNYGVNLRPMCDPSEVSYTAIPILAYLEFLPVEDGDGDKQATANRLVELARVEAGREYEVVVTTHAGLSRGALLSVHVDKTDEAELQGAVERASSALLRPRGAAVADYTSRACTESFPGHYVVYWELLLTTTRRAGAMIRVVRTGTFEELMEQATAHGASIRQYKVPRCATHAPHVIELLDSRVVPSHFSPALPRWTPDLSFSSAAEK